MEYELIEEKKAELKVFDNNAIFLFKIFITLRNVDQGSLNRTIAFTLKWKLHSTRFALTYSNKLDIETKWWI